LLHQGLTFLSFSLHRVFYVSYLCLLCIPRVHGTSRNDVCIFLSFLLVCRRFCICYVGNTSFFLSVYTLLMFPDVNHRPSSCNQLTVLHLIHERTALYGVSQYWKNVFGEEAQCVVAAQLQQERALSYTSASPFWPVTPPYAYQTVGSLALTLHLPHCSTKCWCCALEVWVYTCIKHRVRSSNLNKHIFLSTESIQ